MFLRIWNLVLKELVQFLRDWLMTAFILTLPILQLILLAQATGSRIADLCVAVLDFDRSAESRRLVAALDNQRELDKEYLRRWLMEQGFKGDGHPPVIPDEVYQEVSRRYQQAFEVITGTDFRPQGTDPEAERQKILSFIEERQEEG